MLAGFALAGFDGTGGDVFELACYVSSRELDPGVCRFANGRKWLVEGYIIRLISMAILHLLVPSLLRCRGRWTVVSCFGCTFAMFRVYSIVKGMLVFAMRLLWKTMALLIGMLSLVRDGGDHSFVAQYLTSALHGGNYMFFLMSFVTEEAKKVFHFS